MIPRLHPRARRVAFALWLVWLACSWLKAGTIDTNTPVVVSMPDGQLHTHYIHVRVNRDITHANRPRLFVHVGHALTDTRAGEHDAYPLIELAREHTWTEPVKLPGYAAQDMPLTGTLLLFSLKGLDIHWFKPVIRVRPVLEWVESDGRTNRFVGPREVYVGHTLSAVAISGALFVTKSLLDGALWPVPWQLVALMGMSQAGYVAPKFHYGNPGQNTA